MKLKLLCLCLIISPLVANGPSGFVLWKKGEPPAGTGKLDFGNHSLAISHRDKTGMAEVHDKWVDVLVIQSGEANLVIGGEVVNPKTIAPSETQGDTIRGGSPNMVGPGDVIRIPAGVPHQFLLDPGKQITYFVVKVAAQ